MEKKKPEIRFNGFEGEWVTTTLGACSKKITTKNNGNEYNIVLTNSAERGIVEQRSYFDREIVNTENIQGYYIVSQDDFVYNPRISMQAPVGPINRSKIEYTGVMSPLYYVFRITDKRFSLTYLEWFFKSSSWHNFMYKNGNSGARSDRFSINDDVFLKLPIYHSKDTSEQQKIGLFLTTLDKLIAKLEAKLDKLRKLKQALLEKMFANVNGGGYETPEIRFKGYTDKWQVKELREVATKHSISNQHVHHQNLLSLSYGKIKRKDINSDKGLLPASFDTYQMVKEGVVVMRFTDLQNDKKSLRVGLAKEEGIISPAYVCIYGKESINADFLYQELHYYDSILKLFYSMGDGMRQTLSYTDITTIPISTPQMEEQKKIVDLYDTLDRKITQISTKLTKLRNIKHSLLQKMFA